MAYRKKRNNVNNKFYSDKLAYTTPQLPEPTITSSTFPDKNTKMDTQNYRTPFESSRTYDVTADKVDIQVPGAAPIFGSDTPAQSMTFPQELADFNASLNNVYADDQLALVSTMYRGISLNYMGMDTGIDLNASYSSSPIHLNTYKAYQYGLRNTAQLVTEISAAMYTDLNIFKGTYGSQYQYADDTITISKSFKSPFSGYVGSRGAQGSNTQPQMTDISYMLLQYQLEVMYVVILCYAFEQLVTQLPKLQELYYTKRNYFIYLQNKLKQTRFTAMVKNLLTGLKSRYIDKNFFKEFVLPTLIASKSTDGINSPIMYLIPTLNTTVDYLYDRNKTAVMDIRASAQTINTFMLQQAHFDTRFTDNFPLPRVYYDTVSDSGIFKKELNAFTVDTILDIVNQNADYNAFQQAINTGLQTAFNLLETTENEAVVFANKPVIIDIETMLAKMSSAPKGLNGTTNLEVASLPPMMKYANGELVNELVLYQQGPRITSNNSVPLHTTEYDNGFLQNLPMYNNTGLPKTFIYEYSQAMNGPSNDKYITFFTLSDSLHVKLRGSTTDYELKARTFVEPKSGKILGCFYSEDLDDLDDTITAYPIFQDKVTAIFTKESGTTGGINPHLMTAVTLIYKNKWAEIGQYLNRNYIIPLA